MRTNTRGRAASPFRYSPLVAALACVLAPTQASSATFSVTSTNDFGAGTLREAIQQAVSACNQGDFNSTITFALAGPTSPFVISPSSSFDTIACFSGPMNLTIDGTSQNGSGVNSSLTGFNATLPVVIDGTFGYGGCAFQTSNFGYGDGLLNLKGVEVRNFSYGAAACGQVNVSGSRLVNNSTGVSVTSGTIGGPLLADRNVLSGNTFAGVESADGTVSITNNLIGTDDTGTVPVPNDVGIDFNDAGGVIEGNVVSGNNFDAISVRGGFGVVISGNKLGTTADGGGALGNGNSGVFADCASSVSVLDNIIAGNQYGGVVFAGVSGATVQGNNIGVGVDGFTPMGNQNAAGVSLDFGFRCGLAAQQAKRYGKARRGAKAFEIGGSNNNLIRGNVIANTGFESGISIFSGGDNFVDANTIYDNDGSGVDVFTTDNVVQSNNIYQNAAHGVNVQGGGSTGNTIAANSIYANSLKNINLDMYGGSVPNDLGDADTGPNNLQNFPEIASITHDLVASTSAITWSLNSAPLTQYKVEFFSNPGAAGPAGQTPLFAQTVQTDASGNWTETTVHGGLHDFMTMTATDLATGDTSEFSAAVTVTPTPGATLTPLVLDFGDVSINDTSASLAAVLKSLGTGPYVISLLSSQGVCYGGPPAPPPMCAEGEFVCTTTCAPGTPYANGQQCQFTGKFLPTALGTQSATITVCDNTTGSPRTLTLKGNGVPPTVSLSPASFDFGAVLAGSTSAPQAFVVKNPGTTDVALGAPSVTGAFLVTGTTCGSSLAAESTCDVNVQFAPVAEGPAGGSLSVVVGRGTLTATLGGTGTLRAELSYPRTPIDLGVTPLNGPALSASLPLSNAGNAALQIGNITVGAPFRLVHDCPTVLGAGAGCTVQIFLDATAAGRFNDQLAIVTSAEGGSATIPVTGLVQPRPEPVIRFEPSGVSFGERMAGSASPPQRITIRNEGGAVANIDMQINGAHFLIANSTCGMTLEPQASCDVDVAFQPLGFGARRANLVVMSNAPSSPDMASLEGVGCRPFTFGNRSARPGGNCAP